MNKLKQRSRELFHRAWMHKNRRLLYLGKAKNVSKKYELPQYLAAKRISQADQDKFALYVTRMKRDGTFLEVGAFHSSQLSNTLLLESEFGWKGVSLEIEVERVNEFNSNRANPCLVADATKVNFSNILEEWELPKVIDYVQLDIEPPINTYKALVACLKTKRRFRVITFEHDSYTGLGGWSIQWLATIRLYLHGYVCIVRNVHFAPGYPFEDWYIDKKEYKENIEDFARQKNVLYSDIFVYR